VTDDNFASIVAGIEEGRHAYANVRKVTLFLISTGLAELVLIGLSILVGPPPLLAVQILWLNLVTNGIQDVALAFAIYFLATELPFMQSLLRTQPLPWQMWLLLALPGVVILALMEVYKARARRRARTQAS